MTINFKAPDIKELKPRILVLGVGGAGGLSVRARAGPRRRHLRRLQPGGRRAD